MDASFVISAFKEHQYPPPDRPDIAFAGRSNVGKSSLINTLVNRKGLARTSSRPGRTQSINFFRVNQSIYLVDLPGYGFARVPLKVKEKWQDMVEAYLRGRSTLKAVVVILDIRREPASGDRQLFHWLHHYGIPAIPVATKADKISRQQARNRLNTIGRHISEWCTSRPLLFSAKSGNGKEALWAEIKRVIVDSSAGPGRRS